MISLGGRMLVEFNIIMQLYKEHFFILSLLLVLSLSHEIHFKFVIQLAHSKLALVF